ncbi:MULTISPECIES: hypothetical protein [unclassified Labrenzia]|uniref:hypothetical protein n=1 Tax=unclassified Labrenzia TaxID=2648686 RepID=UPI001268872C|nr:MULTISPECIES: hypothetical protein [unclassified Labrenzia]
MTDRVCLATWIQVLVRTGFSTKAHGKPSFSACLLDPSAKMLFLQCSDFQQGASARTEAEWLTENWQ